MRQHKQSSATAPPTDASPDKSSPGKQTARLAVQHVRAQLHAPHLEVWHDRQLVPTHERLPARAESRLELDHYLEILLRKPCLIRDIRIAAVWRMSCTVQFASRTALTRRNTARSAS